VEVLQQSYFWSWLWSADRPSTPCILRVLANGELRHMTISATLPSRIHSVFNYLGVDSLVQLLQLLVIRRDFQN
jgi:hypothetical protein